MVRKQLRYLRRGTVVALERFDPQRTLLDHLRLDRRETGTKEGCNEGDCGACTVVLARPVGNRISYLPVNACIFLLGQVDGAEIITVEDLAGDALHPIQQAMVRHHGSQCGFCTPGIVMSLFSLYHSSAGAVSRQTVNDCLAGNLCRCTGYRPIIDAAMEVCAGPRDDQFVTMQAERLNKLKSLQDDGDLFAGDDDSFFAAPRSLVTLHAWMAQYPDARLVGGATDVGLWITKRLDQIDRIVWLGRLEAIDSIEETGAELRIGAGVTLADAAPALARLSPDLGEVMRRFGSVQVRASGTVGGNIANGSPIGDLAPCLIALDSEIMLEKQGHGRSLPLEQFFIAYGKQDRTPDEIVIALNVPKPAQNQQFRAYKVSKRFDEDISAVLGAFCYTIADSRVTAARICYGGMAATPRRASKAEAALVGAAIDDPTGWEGAIAALADDYQPLSDARASSGYRLATARALLQKSLFEISGVAPAATRILVPA